MSSNLSVAEKATSEVLVASLRAVNKGSYLAMANYFSAADEHVDLFGHVNSLFKGNLIEELREGDVVTINISRPC